MKITRHAILIQFFKHHRVISIFPNRLTFPVSLRTKGKSETIPTASEEPSRTWFMTADTCTHLVVFVFIVCHTRICLLGDPKFSWSRSNPICDTSLKKLHTVSSYVRCLIYESTVSVVPTVSVICPLCQWCVHCASNVSTVLVMCLLCQFCVHFVSYRSVMCPLSQLCGHCVSYVSIESFRCPICQ